MSEREHVRVRESGGGRGEEKGEREREKYNRGNDLYIIYLVNNILLLLRLLLYQELV